MPPKGSNFGDSDDDDLRAAGAAARRTAAGTAAADAADAADAEAAATAAAQEDAWWQQLEWQHAARWQPQPRTFERGLDAGLAKAMPLDFDGKAQNYRDYRRRLELFRKLCKRRGADCESEGALTLLPCLPTCCWEATRHLDLDVVEGVDGFGKIIEALDKLYRYDDSVEAPIRCQEYFEKFCRKADETLSTSPESESFERG